MKIDAYTPNFETLRRAFASGEVCLVDCYHVGDGKPTAVICAVNRDGDAYELVPLARMFDGNPYDELLPPDADTGSYHGED